MSDHVDTGVAGPHSVGFIHTAQIHAATFAQLVDEHGRGTTSVAHVDESLLAMARELGPEHPDVLAGIEAALADLESRGVSVVVCTCSTIGGVAERVGRDHVIPVLRVDRAMAEAAVAIGSRIAVVAALESTVEPTRELLEDVALDDGSEIDVSVHICHQAWAKFEAGDTVGYLDAVAGMCLSLDGACDVIVLAQASMADAAHTLHVDTPVLSSPTLAVETAIRLARGGPDLGARTPGRAE